MAPADRDTYAAYFEDANEDTGSSIEGTRKYALSDEMPPPKNRPNVGRLLTDQPASGGRHSDSSSKRASLTESDPARSSNRSSDKLRAKARPPDSRRSSSLQDDSDREQQHQRRRQERKARESEQRRSQEHSPKESATTRKPKPAVEHGPHPMARGVSDEYPRYIYQHGMPPARPPVSSRSATYYAGQPPPAPPPPPLPPAGLAWHHPHPHFPPAHFAPGPPGPPMPYPPIHDMSPRGMPLPSPMAIMPPGYFPSPHLAYSDHVRPRFDSRPPSAMGSLGGPERMAPGYSPEEYGDEMSSHVMRRLSRQSRGEDDRRKMPPPERIPQRTMSAAPQHNGPYRPPAGRPQIRQHPPRSSANRHSVTFPDEYDDEESDPSQDLFQDLSPEPQYRQRRYAEPARPRRGSKVYEDVDIIPAGRRSRRSSTYATGGVVRNTGKYESQYADARIRDAQDYQDAVTGGPKMPLTTEMLQKATQGNPSSQSTRSSGSRDDSEYRRSCTTGITRSSSGHGAEDVTIKVGDTVFTVQGGADITFSRGQLSQTRSASDRASTVLQIEDGREQEHEPLRGPLPHRTRAPSHSEHRSRGFLHGSYSPVERPYTVGRGHY